MKVKYFVYLVIAVMVLSIFTSCGQKEMSENPALGTDDVSDLIQGTWIYSIGSGSTYMETTFSGDSFEGGLKSNQNDEYILPSSKGTYTVSEKEIRLFYSNGQEYGVFYYTVKDGKITEMYDESGNAYTKK